jgi:PAS domain S-box-containing protein
MFGISEILENLEEAMITTGKDRQVTSWNRAAERLYGIPSDEALGKPVETLVTIEDSPVTRDEIVRQSEEQGSWRGEVIHRTRNGRRMWVDLSVSRLVLPDLGIWGTVEVSRDITRYKQSETVLREKGEFLESVIEGSVEGIFVLDDMVNYALINPACGRIVGHDPDKWVGRLAGMALHPDDIGIAAEGFTKALSGEENRITLRVMGSDGEYRILDLRLSYLERNRKPHVLGIVDDVTERRRSEKILAESEEKYRHLVDHMRDGIAILQDGLLRFVNPRVVRTLGHNVEELVDTAFDAYLPLEERARLLDVYQRCLAGEVIPSPVEAVVKGKDGQDAHVELSLVPITYRGRPAVLLSGRDVTDRVRAEQERRSLEAQLQQSQKMEAIGTLAGGVAHDMNNVLAAIMGLASVMESEIEPGSPLLKDVAGIIEACKRGRELTLNLLGYARKGRYRKERISLNRSAEEIMALLGRTISRKIILNSRLDENLPAIEGDSSQINHALMNICINATEAIGDEGVLTIETGVVWVDESGQDSNLGLRPGRYVRLQVNDTGTGMSPETLARCCEPFFTTKPAGRGTGLGLSMAYGTVVNHGGALTLDSKVGRGTKVTILLPEAEGATSKPEVLPRKEPRMVSSAHTILLVDDEEMVRSAGKRLLEKLGYSVLLAANGRQALDMYLEKKADVSLVILDLVMPIMDGVETFYKLRHMDPEVKILVSSGYGEKDKDYGLLATEAAGFIQKPFDLQGISEMVAAALKSTRRVVQESS